jgi:hypothetical protein
MPVDSSAVYQSAAAWVVSGTQTWDVAARTPAAPRDPAGHDRLRRDMPGSKWRELQSVADKGFPLWCLSGVRPDLGHRVRMPDTASTNPAYFCPRASARSRRARSPSTTCRAASTDSRPRYSAPHPATSGRGGEAIDRFDAPVHLIDRRTHPFIYAATGSPGHHRRRGVATARPQTRNPRRGARRVGQLLRRLAHDELFPVPSRAWDRLRHVGQDPARAVVLARRRRSVGRNDVRRRRRRPAARRLPRLAEHQRAAAPHAVLPGPGPRLRLPVKPVHAAARDLHRQVPVGLVRGERHQRFVAVVYGMVLARDRRALLRERRRTPGRIVPRDLP